MIFVKLFAVVSCLYTITCFASDPRTVKIAEKNAPDELVYAAIGGSWATGIPNGKEINPGDPCKRHNSSYPILFSSQLKVKRYNFHFIACAADDLFTVIWSQVPRIPANANFVSISAGLDFIGFGDVVQACDVEADVDACRIALDAARSVVYLDSDKGNLFKGMHALVSAIQQRAPQATIVILGFPRWLGSPVENCHKHRGPGGKFVNQDLKDELNELAFEVGAVLLRVVNGTSGKGKKVLLMDPDTDWTNHRYCDEDQGDDWLVPIEAVDQSNPWTSGYYHPNTDGQVELKNLLVRALEQTSPGPKPVIQEGR